jgi:tRNA wybutosine-synthesizing protein 3
LEQLSVPDAAYRDASPKGSVDAAIRELIDLINATAGLVTTSSCAGRVSVFLEGRKAPMSAPMTEETGVEPGPAKKLAGTGGKGGGGKWLYVSHDPVDVGQAGDRPDWASFLGLGNRDCLRREDGGAVEHGREDAETRLIHFKFEPMVRLLLDCVGAF